MATPNTADRATKRYPLGQFREPNNIRIMENPRIEKMKADASVRRVGRGAPSLTNCKPEVVRAFVTRWQPGWFHPEKPIGYYGL
jgi:hypothetical protein